MNDFDPAATGAAVAATAEPQSDSDSEASSETKRGPSQASQLAQLARDRFDLFMSSDGRPYGVAKGKDGVNVVLPLRGKAGLRAQLARIFTDAKGGVVPSASALADAMTVLEGVAASETPRELHLRVARHDDALVVDLATPDGSCVLIRPGEDWSVPSRSPVLFRRSGAMRPLPRPIRDGDGLAKLADLMNCGEEDFRLLVAWLIAAFIPDLPHPILTFRGEQGTGKSTAAAMVIGLIDPSGAPKRTAPRDLKGWAVQAFNSWALCLDNVSVIPDWLSDALCRAVTGDGVVDRALYSDDDVVVLTFRRVLALTTIDAGALAGDLAERLVTIELHTISDRKRREETALQQAYDDHHPAILASLFDLLAAVLEALPNVELKKRPRMADFARVLAAVDSVKGWSTLDTYRAAARDAVSDVLDGDQFANAVIALVDQHGRWEGTASQLLDAIETPERPPKNWPKDATRTSGRVKRLAPALRTIGIDIDDSQRSGRRRLLILTPDPNRKCETASPASPASPHNGHKPVTCGNATENGVTLASPPPEAHLWCDATRDAGDAGVTLTNEPASHRLTGSDLRKRPASDASDARDAEIRLPSDVVTCECPNGRWGEHRDTCPS